MEVIRLSGYASDEKRAIARRYLEPAASTDAGERSLDAIRMTHFHEALGRQRLEDALNEAQKVCIYSERKKWLKFIPTPPELSLAHCSGVPPGAATLMDPAMDVLINEYCREAGVRNLKKHLEKVYRKVALKLVKGGKITIEKTELPDAKALPQKQGDHTGEMSEAAKEGTGEGSGTGGLQPQSGSASLSDSQPSNPPAGDEKASEISSQKV